MRLLLSIVIVSTCLTGCAPSGTKERRCDEPPLSC